MNLKTYLDAKYGGHVYALSANEARILGVPYPLQGGWAKKYAELEITKEMAFRICESMSTKTGRYERKGVSALIAEYGSEPKVKKSERQSAPFPLIMSDELPPDLRRKLDDAAGQDRLSLKDEIIKRLEFSIGMDELRSLPLTAFDDLVTCHD